MTAKHGRKAKTPVEGTRAMQPHEMVLSPSVHSALGMMAWSKFVGDPDPVEMVKELRRQIREVQDGDLTRVEAMLYGQAVSLGAIFTTLARRAECQNQLKQFQANLSLALKAQAQCRATLETLAEIKNPRHVSFVRQANIAQQQQVNNGPVRNNAASTGETPPIRAGANAHAKEIDTVQNELLEASNVNFLDSRTAVPTGSTHRSMEAVGTVHGAANGGR
jgi:hypothetical protein